MLYLTRKSGESLVINDTIRLTIVDVRGRTAKLAFEYPEGTTIFRQELYDRIQLENQEALASVEIFGELLQK